ncbi:hypothetical protein HanIR_Chr01g0049331 [Helianthus annuus]|nr:hypothetical protein HanIR_Chr01g0049331 [Helianthus annuus]
MGSHEHHCQFAAPMPSRTITSLFVLMKQLLCPPSRFGTSFSHHPSQNHGVPLP